MRWLLLVLTVAALAGCGSSPKTQFLTLVPEQSTQAEHDTWHGPALKVGKVTLPGDLDRSELVTLGPGTTVNVSDHARWAAPLDQLVQNALTADLRARLGESQVLTPADPAPPHGGRTLALAVERFAADSDGQVTLATDWTLGRGEPPRPGPVHHARIVVPAGSTDGTAVAAAMSRAIGQLADRIAAAPQ